MSTPSERFAETYTRHLTHQVEKNPALYCFPVTEVPAVVGRMVAGLARGSANKEGAAIRATCKELGIPYTYAGLRIFFGA